MATTSLTKLGLDFYARTADVVARQVLGKILVHRRRGEEYRARIVEAEAYLGPKDLACHASKGLTGRTRVLFGPPAHAYVYFIYGMYDMLNFVTAQEGCGQAVLIRAAEPLNDWHADLSGPGKLTRSMGITRSENSISLCGDTLFLLKDGFYRPRVAKSKRIGVEYAKEWKDALLRFLDARSKAVSRPR
jgi:DNA-3-methyladenine glycosylase